MSEFLVGNNVKWWNVNANFNKMASRVYVFVFCMLYVLFVIAQTHMTCNENESFPQKKHKISYDEYLYASISTSEQSHSVKFTLKLLTWETFNNSHQTIIVLRQRIKKNGKYFSNNKKNGNSHLILFTL